MSNEMKEATGMSRGATGCHFCFQGSTLTAEVRIDCTRVRAEVGRPERGLLQYQGQVMGNWWCSGRRVSGQVLEKSSFHQVS